eukprot:CCRYP_019568-RA/>CCRYP_019568-RA protein AED:0.27 eAED:0.27 QI:0/-1/0/1/-1/1/1/0/289
MSETTSNEGDSPTPADADNTSTRPQSHTCSGRLCPHKDRNRTTPLQSCARCHTTYYCGRDCQKSHWEVHKHQCVSADTPRHSVTELTVRAIQSAIHEAGPGDVIVLSEGLYEGNEILTIDKPLVILGGGREMTTVSCDELVVGGSDLASYRKHSLVMADFEVTNPCTIKNNHYKAVNICNIRFSCPLGSRNDAVSTSESSGKILFLDCEIIGGGDGLCIGGDGVHLKRTCIRNAQFRGIFSRRHFVVEDVTISGCGGYGIKGTAGWDEKGKNRIQPGPWANFGGAYGGW